MGTNVSPWLQVPSSVSRRSSYGDDEGDEVKHSSSHGLQLVRQSLGGVLHGDELASSRQGPPLVHFSPQSEPLFSLKAPNVKLCILYKALTSSRTVDACVSPWEPARPAHRRAQLLELVQRPFTQVVI
jgi:hypothetical protein